MSNIPVVSGKSKKVMEFNNGEEWVNPINFSINCHVCGLVISPIKGILVATNLGMYKGNVFCRIFDIK